MKRILAIFLALIPILSGCVQKYEPCDIVATTMPVYEFTSTLCQGTDIRIGQLVTDSISCLHDYSLSVNQMRLIEQADSIILSGAGLEDFLDPDLLADKDLIDASQQIHAHGSESHEHDHSHDPHIWLSPENARQMAINICRELEKRYPEHKETFKANLMQLEEKFDQLSDYGAQHLAQLESRELITFHDGFSYFAESFDLSIVKAIEEESGSEASAAELKELILLVESHGMKAIFTETNGSTSAAQIISSNTGAKIYTLDMAISGNSYFEIMYHNIDTIKEALG